MIGYNTPQIFKPEQQENFVNFLRNMVAVPFEAHVDAEAERLSPLLDAASRVLIHKSWQDKAPDMITDHIFSAKGLHRLFINTAHANGHVAFSMPIIIPELFHFIGKDRFENSLEKNNISYDHMIPDRYRRMFWTSKLTLMRVSHQYRPDQSLIFPIHTIPDTYFNAVGHEQVLIEGARLAEVANHDWFHHMLYTSIESDFNHRPEGTPLKRLAESDKAHLEIAFNDKTFAKFKLPNHIEPLSFRFHREIMIEMLRGNADFFTRHIDSYTDAVKNSPVIDAPRKLWSPPISPQDYAARWLAFCMIRIAPKNHPITDYARQKMKEALKKADNPCSKGVDAIFNHVYSAYHHKILHGNGGQDARRRDFFTTSARYGRHTLELSRHFLQLATHDCLTALDAANTPMDESPALPSLDMNGCDP